MNISRSPAIASSIIGEGESVALEIRGESILVCRSGGQLYAISNKCTHANSRLEGGKLCDGVIKCPLHGARFRLSTGECLSRPLKYAPLQTFAISEVNGEVWVDLPDPRQQTSLA